MFGDFTKVVKGQWKDPTGADVTITTESCIGRGVPLTQRALCEEENEQAVGRLRNAARAVDRVVGWKEVGFMLSKIIEEVVMEHEGACRDGSANPAWLGHSSRSSPWCG